MSLDAKAADEEKKKITRIGKGINRGNAIGAGALVGFSVRKVFLTFLGVLFWPLWLVIGLAALFVALETWAVYDEDPTKDFWQTLKEYGASIRHFRLRYLLADTVGHSSVLFKAILYGVGAAVLLIAIFSFAPIPFAALFGVAAFFGVMVGLAHYAIQAIKLVRENKIVFNIDDKDTKKGAYVPNPKLRHKKTRFAIKWFALSPIAVGQGLAQGAGAFLGISILLGIFLAPPIAIPIALFGGALVAWSTGLFYGRSLMNVPNQTGTYKTTWVSLNKKGKSSALALTILALTCKAALAFVGGMALMALLTTPPGWVFAVAGVLTFCAFVGEFPKIFEKFCGKLLKSKRFQSAAAYQKLDSDDEEEKENEADVKMDSPKTKTTRNGHETIIPALGGTPPPVRQRKPTHKRSLSDTSVYQSPITQRSDVGKDKSSASNKDAANDQFVIPAFKPPSAKTKID